MNNIMAKKIILIDANALVHRAFHALPALTSPNGIVTNAAYGFTSILLKTIKELKPDYMAAAFDLAGPTFRHEQFEEYKSHRVKAPEELYRQIPLVKEVLSAFGIPVYELAGFEADDLIGTLATKAKQEKDLEVIIATGDLDALQLVQGEKVRVFTLRKGMADTIIYDEEGVMARYGLKPSQLNDYRGLKGDPSDNIPGVPGVGEKTASELIKEFGSLEKLYEFLENKQTKNKSAPKQPETISPKLKEKLIENKNQAFFSKQLSEIVTDLDIDFSLAKANWRENLNLPKIETVFKDLGFFSLLKRLPEIGLTLTLEVGSQPGFQLDVPEEKTAQTESNSTKANIYIVDEYKQNIPLDILADKKKLLIGHDLKMSLKPLIANGAEIKCQLFDTKIAAYLLSPDLREYEFEKIYYGQFRVDANDPRKKSEYLAKLYERLWQKIKASRLEKVFEDIEMPLIKVVAQMELNGIKINTNSLEKLLKSTNLELTKLEKEIYKLAGETFNINSPQQLGEILFKKLAIKGRVRKTAGGAISTAAPELEKIRDEHPIIDLVLEQRELQKLKTTYIEPFPVLVQKDGRIHTTYSQVGAATGRLASLDPNLQNIPVRTALGQEFRKAFVAEKGYQLVSFDYSQLELRIVAHVARDHKMIEAFQRGEDIHTRTATEIFGVPPEKVTKDMRRQAKVLNFGIIYGMGLVGFSRASGVDRSHAREFIGKYFSEFSGVAKYMEEIKAKAHRDGYVETIFGRRRQLLDIHSSMPQIQAGAERAAINHPIQGTAADLMKLAMIGVYDLTHGKYISEDFRLLLQVHDELVCEIKSDLVPKIAKEIKEIMESVHKLSVPLIVEIKSGKNWQDSESITHK